MKIGLALGSGAMRGLAHIGVLQVLEREHIPIDVITGTSMGAVIAGAYASGRGGLELEEIVRSVQEMRYFDFTVPKDGMISGKRAHKFMSQLTCHKTFAQTRIPCAMVATDLSNGEEVVLTDGLLGDAIRASISIPGIFVPVKYPINADEDTQQRTLVDGGMVNRVPVNTARMLGADYVIAVDVGYRGETIETSGLLNIFVHALDIMEWEVTREKVNTADVLIVPDVREFNPALVSHSAESIARGREAARAALPEIMKLINA
ncbi:MAG: patatin-like phospholipase family protein [Oscillospiraceae bacterium]|jgi:NTE family protein|nr:patatin-like phospholipase family protein [Oscillospiraceae bacterium]